MSPLQWVLLCILFTLYLLFGGSVFMYFEQRREIEKKEEISVLRKDINEILLQLDKGFYHNDTTQEIVSALTAAKIGVIYRISAACDLGDLVGEDVPNSLTNEDESNEKIKWNFYNSVFFAFTVVTTIGYGHLSPSTSWSKGFVMIYALIGIPINSILLSGVGDYFASRLVKVHKKSKDKPERRFTFFFEILLYLIPGIVVFIIIPAGIFVIIESWTFLDSVYYAFVSLTTIGFGDYVAGMGNAHFVWMWLYKAFIIIWITFGLGYLIMILGFISKGMTHKKVTVVIEKRLNTIRLTKEKLSRDIDYMRRVVNELYLMKIKPIYEFDKTDEDFQTKCERTKSQPCIRLEKRYDSLSRIDTLITSNGDIHSNYSEKQNQNDNNNGNCKLPRRCSDSDLNKIDRDKTFETAIQQHVTVDELLVSVVNALSGNVMHEVMDAVEELNGLENEVIAEQYHDHGSNSMRRNEEDLPSWDLGALSESDEEGLIDEDEEGSLSQVVVHNGQPVSKNNGNFVDRVTGVMRKISSGNRSSGNRSPAEGPSRKVSRNETPRKISRIGSSERINTLGHSSQRSPQFRNPQAYAHHTMDRKISHRSDQSNQRKISEESRISNFSIGSRLSTDESNRGIAPSRKTSPASVNNEEQRSRISLESTSLADFLQALDTVHCRLNAKTSVHSMGTPETNRSDSFYRSSFRRSDKFSRSSDQTANTPRRRKNGITHPNFAYVNDGFSPSFEDEKDKKDSSPDPFLERK